MIANPILYPRYKPSGLEWLGDVPAHWDVRRLKAVCRLAYGDSLPSNARGDGDVPVYGSNGPVGMHIAANTEAPCIVVGRKGSFGKIHYSTRPVFVIDTTYYVDERHSTANLAWLSRVLGWLRLDAVTRDSAIPGLSREDAYDRSIPLPPLPEQAAIVRYLDHADRRIQRYIGAKQKLITLLEEQKQALIHRAVTRGLDPDVRLKPSGVEWLGDVPEHWGVRRLKTLCSMRSGEGITAMSIEPLGDYPVYGGNGLRGYATDYTHDGDFALIGRQGALCGNVHIARGRFWASEHAVVATLHLGHVIEWFGAILGAMNLNQYSIAAAQPGLAVERVLNLWLPVPPSQEQATIVRYLDKATAGIDTAIDRARRQIELLREYRTRLIADVVTGKLDVRGAVECLMDETEEPDQLDGPDDITGEVDTPEWT